MRCGDRVPRSAQGPQARRRPGTTWPPVTPWGGGGVPAPPRAGIPQKKERRARSRAAAPRPLPPTPPPRGAPAPAGPGSQEASLPRPADEVRCEAGAGVIEKTPLPPPPQFGRVQAAALWAAGRGRARSAGTVRARPRPPAGESARRAGEERAPGPARARAGWIRGARAAGSGISPHSSPSSDRPDLPPRSRGVVGDPSLTEKASGLQEWRTSGHNSPGANCVSLRQSAPQFTLLHPPPPTPLAVTDRLAPGESQFPPLLLNQRPLSVSSQATFLAKGQQRLGEPAIKILRRGNNEIDATCVFA